MKRPLSIRILVAALCLPFLAPAAISQQGGEMPPTPVSFLELKPQPLPVINELPGRVSATRLAEVRPRISGIVLERVFEQGSTVKAGDVLYRIDPAPFRVRVASAEATLAKAKAGQLNAQDQQKRAQTLRDRNITAGVDLENAVTTLAQADADVAIAEAALAEAQLNLDYTEVKAPISGIIGRALVTEGALVTAQTEVMATIQQLAVDANTAQMRLYFDDGTEYDQPGEVLFSEATVDELTGQVTMRGEFPNTKNLLLPGLYVRVAVEQAVREHALAVPQMAVQRDAQGNAQVYVIGTDNTVSARNLRLGTSVGAFWIVESGLNDGEKVVVEGAQKLFPGAVVVPEPWQPPATDAPQN
jgi:membrane fusion protein (multidrug efflux system)